MSDESQKLGQDDIEKLLAQAKATKPAGEPAKPAKSAGPIETVGQDEIEQLLKQNAAAKGAAPPPAAPIAASTPPAEDPGGKLAQSDIEALFAKKAPAATAQAPAAAKAADPVAAREGGLPQRDLELLLNQAEAALASINAPAPPARSIPPFKLEEFVGATPSQEMATLELIRDVELDLRIEFGRTHMFLEDVLRLRRGSVVPLDKLAGDPVDIFVNGRLIARGEVLVLNDNFCVRVAELIAGEPAAA